MLNVKTIKEAQQIVINRFAGLRTPAESVTLEDALGRVLSEEMHSEAFVPDFNRSTVDGYAVRARDVFGCSESIPALLTQVGEVHMGKSAGVTVGEDQCVYVPTGGEVPEGADTVVMLENAEILTENEIAIYKPAAPGNNMIFRGDDLKPGDLVFPAGTILNVPAIGSLAAMGLSSLRVHKKPFAAIISTGDELVPPGEALPPGMIRDVNAPLLLNALRENGADGQLLGIIPDQYPAVKQTVQTALEKADLVILSGGTSVGVKDAVPLVVAELGELLVHGVAAKPGKPTLFGAVDGKPVFGLPGNPVAAYFMFIMLVRPLLYAMTGATPLDRHISLPIARSVPSNHGREEFVPVQIKDGLAHPIASKSGLITTLSCADGFLRIPRDTEGLAQGMTVDVTLFAR